MKGWNKIDFNPQIAAAKLECKTAAGQIAPKV
jgi:hypothetical protein